MEPIDSHFLPFSSKDDKVEEEEAVDLLEKCWFFNNLLDTKARMLRSSNSHLPHSNTTSSCPEMSLVGENSSVETSAPIRAFLESITRDSDQAPSPSPDTELDIEKKDHDYEFVKNKLNKKSPGNGLIRAPSLPSYFGRDEVEAPDEKSDHEMGKLTRQVTPNPPDSLPPRLSSKGKTQALARGQPRRLARAESLNIAKMNEGKHRYMNQKKSLNDLEIEEVQGFKDLGFRFDKKDLSQSVINILPGLQEKKRLVVANEDDDIDKARRPYLSEAWLAQSSTPPIPNWVVKKSKEDMKAHIKSWARSVASNVR